MLAALVAGACGGGDKPSEPAGPGTLAKLIIPQASLDTLSELSTRQLTVTGADASGRGIVGLTANWTSSDTNVATVTATGGVVTARLPGSTTISAQNGAVGTTLALRILPVPVRDLTVRLVGGLSADTMFVGSTVATVVEARDAIGAVLAGRSISVSVADTTRGSVDASGRLTGRVEGMLELVVRTDTVVRRRTVIVRPALANGLAVRLVDPKQLHDTLWVGLRDSVVATYSDAAGKVLAASAFRPVSFSTSDSRIVTIDASGRVVPLAPGQVTVRVNGDGLVASRALVVVAAPLAGVVSASDTVRIAPSDSAQLRPLLVDAVGLSVRSLGSAQFVRYTSLDPARAAVSAQGWVRGLAEGVARVQVAIDNVTTVVPVKVSRPDTARAFKIEVRFVGPAPTAAVRAAFDAARLKWQSVIRETIGSITDTIPKGLCGSTDETHLETVQDVVIFARIDSIDGPSNILGQAGPCAGDRLASGKFIPHIGRMAFDSADMTLMVNRNILTAVITHEMGHVLGIGTLWSAANTGGVALARQTGSDPRFFGSGGTLASGGMGLTFYSLGATGPAALESVPLENTGGSGTAGSHWRESVYDNELMTGFVNNGANPLSLLTVQAMADMGYSVATSAAEPLGKFFTAATSAVRYQDVFGTEPGVRLNEQLVMPEWIHTRGARRFTRIAGTGAAESKQ